MLIAPETAGLEPDADASAPPPTEPDDECEDWELEETRGRDPLPAGHPQSWGALTAGTLLEGMPYPLPVFER